MTTILRKMVSVSFTLKKLVDFIKVKLQNCLELAWRWANNNGKFVTLKFLEFYALNDYL